MQTTLMRSSFLPSRHRRWRRRHDARALSRAVAILAQGPQARSHACAERRSSASPPMAPSPSWPKIPKRARA